MKPGTSIPFAVHVVKKGKHAGKYHLVAAQGAYERVAMNTGKSVKKLHRLAAKKKRLQHKQGYKDTPIKPMVMTVRTKAQTEERVIQKRPHKAYERLANKMSSWQYQ